MRIGILGGTFDPIHNGHLYLAQKARKKLSLDRVIFIPAHLPPHKKNVKVTNARDRYNMVKLAISDNERLKVSDIEIKRKGRSYSVETLRRLRKRYGVSIEIFFITGSDSLADLDKWKNIEDILKLCKFVVVKRPQFDLSGSFSSYFYPRGQFVIKNATASFIILNIQAKDISSTDIRKRIKKGMPVTKFVPAKVREYIAAHKLYV